MTTQFNSLWPRRRRNDEPEPVTPELRAAELAAIESAVSAGRLSVMKPAGCAPATQDVRHAMRRAIADVA